MKQIIEQSGKTIKEFAEFYEIPYNTVRQWYNGERSAPLWVKSLIEKAENRKQISMFEENEYELYEFFNENGLQYRAHKTGDQESEEWFKKRLKEWNEKKFKTMRVSKVRLIAEYKI